MVEVFKTDVHDLNKANILINQIQEIFVNYQARFDLEDCDRILRVESPSGIIQSNRLIDLLKDNGFTAEVLPDDPPFKEEFLKDTARKVNY